MIISANLNIVYTHIMDAREPVWRPANPKVDDEVLMRFVERIEEAKPFLEQGLYREKELTDLWHRASKAYEATADHNSIQYRKYDRKRREFPKWREVKAHGYVDMDDAEELIDLQQQIVELLNLHGVEAQPTEIFIAPRTPYTTRTYIRNIFSRAEVSIDIKDDYLFSVNKGTKNVEILNILQPYLSSSLNISVRLLGSNQNPPAAVASDVKLFLRQYANAEIKGNAPVASGPKETHDRFIIIDQKEVYKVGTSIKDLGSAQSAIDQVNDLAALKSYITQFSKWWNSAVPYTNIV